MITAILFDFFGTLVEYSPSRVEQGYHATHELLLNEGVDISYAAFLDAWAASFEALDRWSQSTGREYSMEQVAHQFVERVCPQRQSRAFSTRLWMSYLAEWSTAIRTIPGVRELMEELSARLSPGRRHKHPLRAAHSLAPSRDRHQPAHGCRRDIHRARQAQAASEHLHVSARTSRLRRKRYTLRRGLLPADYLGAKEVGMRALLIDPCRAAGVPRTKPSGRCSM